MNTNDKLVFVDDLISNVARDIKLRIKRGELPSDWNGIELRQYIADKFADCVITGTMGRGRMREYRNEIVTRNL